TDVMDDEARVAILDTILRAVAPPPPPPPPPGGAPPPPKGGGDRCPRLLQRPGGRGKGGGGGPGRPGRLPRGGPWPASAAPARRMASGPPRSFAAAVTSPYCSSSSAGSLSGDRTPTPSSSYWASTKSIKARWRSL